MAALTHDAALDGLTDEALISRVGGKGLGLCRLRRLKLPVPPFFVLEAREYRKSGRFPAKLEAPLLAALEKLGPGPYAVRSSAVAEDGAKLSFAGQLESVLGPETPEDVQRAISTCWRSGNSERVQAYCAQSGVEPSPVAVVVQRLVRPISAGVLFTATPEDPDRALISAAWGLGEGVVQGSVPCDTFRVSAAGEIEAELDDKDTRIELVQGQLESTEVPLDQRDIACLSESVIRKLARLGAELEGELGRPQDIEFAVSDEGVHILQVRPVTATIPRGRKLLWDNSNIVESYNGVTTPMTYSFAKRAYTIIYQLFCRVMGVDAATLRENEPMFHRMIGLVQGRIFYNLNAWYGILTLLPGYKLNRSFMEQMMGVSEVAADEDAEAEAAGWQRALIHGPRVAWLSLTLVWRLATLDRSVRQFEQTFAEAYATHRDKDLDSLGAFELMDIYSDLETRLLWAWTPPIVNDFFVMIFYGMLRKQCQQLTGDEDTRLHNELLAGEGGLESTAPTIEALHMAARMRKDEGLVELFTGPASDAEVYEQAMQHEGFARRFARYIRLYGDRCVDELKLETASLRQDPSFLVSTLRNYLRGRPVDPNRFGEEERALRVRAEQQAFGLVSGARGVLFKWILDKTRLRVKTRENLRFSRTRIFGLVRDIIRAWGLRLVEAGKLDAREDVFYLTIDEVQGWIRGTTVSTDLRGLVELRRAEFEGFQAGARPDERFYTRGPVHFANSFKGKVLPSLSADGQLQGTPCCPGVAEGPVRVLDDPRQGATLAGEILVAERTDPGWVPLYPCISGLIIERGSLLSHSAVVAREMGIPTIVGLRGLTERLNDGDRVRMDGGSGLVELLDEEPSPDEVTEDLAEE
jgi:phosphohistidine swiveling domain-containing protein